MKKLLRALAVVVLGLSLTTGIAAANASIDTTGPGSRNTVESRSSEERRVENNNDVRVRNNNPQSAHTGDATADWNTTAGDADTGDAENDSLLRAHLRVNNSGALDGVGSTSNGNGGSYEIGNTGPNSHNRIETSHRVETKVTNNNSINVENNNSQSASSGTAVVSGNTSGGSASSGNASNISTTDVTVDLTN